MTAPNVRSLSSKKVPRTYLVARITVFAALSVVGSFIHLYSSLALDSAPGFFAALYFGPLDGFCIFGLGHMATAIVSGFPFGFLHLPIALGLAVAGAAVGIINRKWNVFPAVATGIAINTALVVVAIPVYGMAFTLSFIPPLFLDACFNGAIGAVLYFAVRRRLRV